MGAVLANPETSVAERYPASWFVAQCNSTMINHAKFFISKDGFEHYDPHVYDGKRRMRLFPGYLLVKFSMNDPWQTINRAFGVVRLLPKVSEIPEPLPVHFVDDLREMVKSRSSPETVREQIARCYALGDKVQIVHGVFEGNEGIFEGWRGSSMVLSIMLFSRRLTRVAVPPACVM